MLFSRRTKTIIQAMKNETSEKNAHMKCAKPVYVMPARDPFFWFYTSFASIILCITLLQFQCKLIGKNSYVPRIPNCLKKTHLPVFEFVVEIFVWVVNLFAHCVLRFALCSKCALFLSVCTVFACILRCAKEFVIVHRFVFQVNW